MNLRYNYINAHVEDDIVKIDFVKSAENDSNILAKNSSGDLHERILMMIGKKPE